MWCYVAFGLVFNILIGRLFKESPNQELFANIYIFLEYFLISAYFYRKLHKKPRWVMLIGIASFLIAIPFLVSNLFAFSSVSAAILSFSYIIYCVLSLHAIMVDTQIKNVFESSFFLCVIALFIYFTGRFLLYSTGHYFSSHELMWGFKRKELMSGLWMINSCCNIIQSLLFTWAFLAERKYSK